MPKEGEVKLVGFEETMKALEELPLAVEKRVLRRALKDAAQPVANMAESLAPRDSRRFPPGVGVTHEAPPSCFARARS